MKKEFKVLKCKKCDAMVMTFKECNCDDCEMMCCGETMKQVVSNSVDASFEKHLPTYEIKEDKLIATVNHVMEEEHYIEWIAYVTKDSHEIRYFEPEMTAQTEFKYFPNSKLYAYCNKHGLWESEVE